MFKHTHVWPRRGSALLALAFSTALMNCADKASVPIATGPTGLSGVVSVDTEAGPTVAKGREVVLSRPDTASVRASESICERSDVMKEQLRLRVAGQRQVLPAELPLDRQIQVWSEYLTEGVRAAFEFQHERVAVAVTDSTGTYRFTDLPPGYYAATSALATTTTKHAWTALVDVKAHAQNTLNLDNRVATGATICASVAEAGQRLAAAR